MDSTLYSPEVAADLYADKRYWRHVDDIEADYLESVKRHPEMKAFYLEVKESNMIGAESLIPVYRECYLKRYARNQTHLLN